MDPHSYAYYPNVAYLPRHQQHHPQYNSTPAATPPQSSSANSSPGMAYSSLHHGPYTHPVPAPHIQHTQYTSHAFPSPAPYPSRRSTQPPSQPSASAQPPSQPSRASALSNHPHPDVYYAPNAALLYNHANAIAAAQAHGQNASGSPDVNGYASGGSTPPRLPPILQVEKQQVTTSATQAASASRRRNEAHFVCPVPGCGSTFTRRFNLRGHLRSHTEERPYVCEWPGCHKGFARQHDCKRHQALHTSRSTANVCHGCGKTFSRLDALNRHLRSEGGAECRRTHEQAVASQKQTQQSKPNPLGAFRAVNGHGPGSGHVNGGEVNGDVGGLHPINRGNIIGHRQGDSGSSAYDSDGTGGARSVQVTPGPGPAPSLAAA